MPKSILIFSDGTGQSGGVTFDENRTNIYKLFRATRCGPDSTIDPAEQVAFYDPGLGSPRDNHFAFGWLGRKIYNFISQGTGFGITANIIDCYAALIRLWRPGDRIYLFGFSRGAYTVRCLAAVIASCGIPTKLPNGEAVELDVASSKKLASYAVKHVYQFTSSRPRQSATAWETFLLETRDLIALRFRQEHGSIATNSVDANVFPYFVGVLDTVAALLNPMMSLLLLCTFLVLDAVVSWTLLFVPDLPMIGGEFAFLGSFWPNFLAIVRLTIVLGAAGYIFTHFKFDFRVPGYNWRQKLCTMHWSELYQRFYDYTLNPSIPYAKHAISIDENRRDFQRVGWDPGQSDRSSRDEKGNIFFEQVWFPGNHTDIGGGYEENESRLSDATLHWMVVAATAIPHPIQIDPNVLKTHPAPVGRSHNEVKVGFGLITTLTGLNWVEQHRELPSPSATMHKSVYERFDAIEAFEYDEWSPYRPQTLRSHVDFARFYEPNAPFPATSLSTATALADDPESRLN
ncbi:MAG TPA: DUF2235 domain-containing protein [Xanthobacteraceae bacterium]|nr:DUF2235 domain-containing protein [Xanthobacteraceae bacterium]